MTLQRRETGLIGGIDHKPSQKNENRRENLRLVSDGNLKIGVVEQTRDESLACNVEILPKLDQIWD